MITFPPTTFYSRQQIEVLVMFLVKFFDFFNIVVTVAVVVDYRSFPSYMY